MPNLIILIIICALISVATGSSWTTSATVGIALIGIGKAMGLPVGMIAGAVISGAYFGDNSGIILGRTWDDSGTQFLEKLQFIGVLGPGSQAAKPGSYSWVGPGKGTQLQGGNF